MLFLAYGFGSHVPVDIMRVLFIPDFLAESLKANENYRERSLILRYRQYILRYYFLLTLKIICSQNTAKKLSQFTSFPANIFLLGVRKNIWTAPFYVAQ